MRGKDFKTLLQGAREAGEFVRHTQRSSWMREKRAARTPKPAAIKALTAAQDSELLQAWQLRQALSNRALERHFGLTTAQIEHQLRRVRKAAGLLK